MIREFIDQWEENKHKLEEYFKTHKQSEYDSYEAIVKKIFELVITKWDNNIFDVDQITVIDHGDYQGTQLFIIPKNTYQPSISDYIVLNNYYGSCSGCDTLQAIQEYDSLPNKKQVKEYMTLALHLVQRIKKLDE